MKKTQVVLIVLIIGLSAKTYAQCNSCLLIGDRFITLDNDIKTYRTQATPGARYFWTATGGLSIQSSTTEPLVDIKALSQRSGKLCVTRYEDRKEPCTNCIDIKIIERGQCLLYAANIERIGAAIKCSGIGLKVYTNLGEENDCDLSYNWFIDKGEILSGQGTSTIIISTDILNPTVGVKVGTCCEYYTTASLQTFCDLCDQPEPCLE